MDPITYGASSCCQLEASQDSGRETGGNQTAFCQGNTMVVPLWGRGCCDHPNASFVKGSWWLIVAY